MAVAQKDTHLKHFASDLNLHLHCLGVSSVQIWSTLLVFAATGDGGEVPRGPAADGKCTY